ncbi:MAG TPA: group 1 truncated hemoglobin [Kofleriaceae bacterium]|nr:group 1 truncated hemoglobin [Kofleriaceae bacterium]
MMRLRQLLIVLCLGAAAACGGSKKSEPTTTTTSAAKPLYDRLGGKDGITAVVEKLVENIAADARINAQFANADTKNLKTKLVDQICEASGGPCKYTGKNMKEAHVGMKITEGDFNALVEDLVKAMDTIGVPKPEQDELLGALGGMKGDIVTVQ